MNKRFLSILLALCMALTLLPVTVWATEETSGICGKNGDNLSWNYNGGTHTLTISGTGEMMDYHNIVYNGNTDGTNAPWYYLQNSISTIIIQEGVTSIGNWAFQNIKHYISGDLTVMLPSSLITIGEYAFQSCSYLTNITLPSNITYIGRCAFKSSALKSIVIPDGVTSIESDTFCYCGKLVSVVLPPSIERIGSCAFFDFGASTITIPQNVSSIDEAALSSSKLTEIVVEAENNTYASRDGVLFSKDMSTLILCPQGKSGVCTIPESVTHIESNAFRSCYKLTEIFIPNTITTIERSTFYRCSGLTSIVIPNNVVSIGDSAFYECNKLTSIFIPRSVTSIGSWTFKPLSYDSSTPLYLADFYYEGSESEWQSISFGENAISPNATIYYNSTGLGEEGNTANMPVITVDSSTPGTAAVTITAEAGATIYYTTNGVDPVPGAKGTTKYSKVITLTENTTVKAIAVKPWYNNSPVATSDVKVYVAAPVATPKPGSFKGKTTVKLTCATKGAEIWYTLGSGAPTKYTSAITLTDDAVITAYAVKTNMENSKTETFTYTKQLEPAAKPTANPKSGKFSQATEITLTSNTGATIYYTWDGNEPTTESASVVSGGTVRLDKTRADDSGKITLKAFARGKAGEPLTDSGVVTFTYTWNMPTADAPILKNNEKAGTFTTFTTTVTLSAENGAAIYYTDDGVTTPTAETGTLYSGPITINKTTTIKAIAVQGENSPADYNDSKVATFKFTQRVGNAVAPTVSGKKTGLTEATASVTLSSKTAGATIKYTVDGSNPATSGTVKTAKSGDTVNVSAPTEGKTVLLWAIAVSDQMYASKDTKVTLTWKTVPAPDASIGEASASDPADVIDDPDDVIDDPVDDPVDIIDDPVDDPDDVIDDPTDVPEEVIDIPEDNPEDVIEIPEK